MCRTDCHQPKWATLPAVDGCPDARWMGTMMIDEREYVASGFHVRPALGHDYWVGEVAGLRRYAQWTWADRERRIAAGKERRAADSQSWAHFEGDGR